MTLAQRLARIEALQMHDLPEPKRSQLLKLRRVVLTFAVRCEPLIQKFEAVYHAFLERIPAKDVQ